MLTPMHEKCCEYRHVHSVAMDLGHAADAVAQHLSLGTYVQTPESGTLRKPQDCAPCKPESRGNSRWQ